VQAEHRGEAVDEGLAGQVAACADPVVRVCDGAEIDDQKGADGTEADENRAAGQGRAAPAQRFLGGLAHKS